MLVVYHDSLFAGGFVSAHVLMDAPVTAPAAQDTASTGHAARQLLHRCAVKDGEIPLGHRHVPKAQRQNHFDKVVSWRHSRDLAGVRGATAHSSGAHRGRTLTVLEETGVRFPFLQHRQPRDKERYRVAFIFADIGRAELLDAQTLLLDVKTPEPLPRLPSSCTLRLQQASSLQDAPATVRVVSHETRVTVLMSPALCHRSLLQHVLCHNEEVLLGLVQDEVCADGSVGLDGDDRIFFNLTIRSQKHLV